MSSRYYIMLLLLALLFCGWRMNSVSDVLVTIAKVSVYKDSLHNTISYTSGLTIDADGSPHAYHPVSDSGSDKLANAGHKGDWWGIVTEKGEPVVQGENDPAPGFYISCTSLCGASKKLTDPARYVNSDSIPYIVIPNNKTLLGEVKMGDIAKVKNLRNGKTSYAICADVGPIDKIGEGSIYLARKLDVNSSPRTGGVSDSISYVIYIGSGNGKPQGRPAIDSIGAARDSAGN